MTIQENLVDSTIQEEESNPKKPTKVKKDSKTTEEQSNNAEGKTSEKPVNKPKIRKRTTLKVSEEEPKESEKSTATVANNPTVSPEKKTEVTTSEDEPIFFLKDIKTKKVDELIELSESLGIENPHSSTKQDIVFNVLKSLAQKGAVIQGEGTLEILSDGYGFLRSGTDNYYPGSYDIYVSPNQIRKLDLRSGDTVSGPIRAPKKGERYFALIRAEEVNSVACRKHRPHFDDLTPLYPDEKFVMESVTHKKDDLSARIVDIMTPIGKGQRALIVAPPRSGKTTLMRSIAQSIAENHPESYLMVLLVDERPEEVTDMKRFVKGEVVSSTFDEPSSRHVQLAEIVIEKAKRLVEDKRDVVILLDNITRLARAYNNTAPSSGKVLSGGVDSNALQRPKRFFGAARNIEEGGSLTIIATALIETGSRMDEVIFEEFKGTGNSEIVLDRKISDRRIYPAIDILRSGTRKEDLLLPKNILSKTWILRKVINSMSNVEAAEFLIDKLKFTRNNKDFFEQMQSF